MGTSRLKQTQLGPSSAAEASPLWNLAWEERGQPIVLFPARPGVPFLMGRSPVLTTQGPCHWLHGKIRPIPGGTQ